MDNTTSMATRKNTAKAIATQTLIWTAALSLILIFCFTLGNFDSLGDPSRYSLKTLLTYTVASLGIALFATLHYYTAYLPLFTRKKYGKYVLVCIVVYILAKLVCALGYVLVIESSPPTPQKMSMVSNRAGSVVFLLGVPFIVLYTAFYEARRVRARRREIESASRRTSMLLLAKKLEPHFLFNSLNAVYAIAQHESAANTITAIDNISEKLRGQLDSKTDGDSNAVSGRRTEAFLFQFLFVWLGVLIFTVGIEGFGYLRSGQWQREPGRFWIYQPAIISLVAFTITGHFYLLYKPFVIGKQYRKYFLLLLPFTLAMIALDVAVNYFLVVVMKMLGEGKDPIGRYIMIALARVFTAEAICAWIYATVSHYRHSRRQRDAALQQQQRDEQRLQQTRIDTEALFSSLRELENAAGTESTPRTKEAVAELVSLFRYSAVHAGDITVPVEEEFAFLRRYIHLQQMRIRQNAGVRITAMIEAVDDNALIAPMLLLPYIENAFKYGISYAAPSFIDIRVSVTGDILECHILNTDHSAGKRMSSAGMGMADTLKRLQLQYEGKFSLEAGGANGVYAVRLRLELD